MTLIKQTFTIGELETLTGIKAHTIRIWEKRYSLLTPQRKLGNSRYYTNDDLQKLLNIALLIQKGHKISKIANYTEIDIQELLNATNYLDSDKKEILYKLREAMMCYNEGLFLKIIVTLREKYSFEIIFKEYLLVLLEEIGILWQTKKIVPGHEHFISNLVRMFIIAETSKLPIATSVSSKTYVLFTPINEIHELGLLYLQNQIKSNGHHCIYLGTHIPIDTLLSVQKQHESLTFVSNITIYNESEVLKLLNDLKQCIDLEKNTIWLYGKQLNKNTIEETNNVFIFNSIQEIIAKLH